MRDYFHNSDSSTSNPPFSSTSNPPFTARRPLRLPLPLPSPSFTIITKLTHYLLLYKLLHWLQQPFSHTIKHTFTFKLYWQGKEDRGGNISSPHILSCIVNKGSGFMATTPHSLAFRLSPLTTTLVSFTNLYVSGTTY